MHVPERVMAVEDVEPLSSALPSEVLDAPSEGMLQSHGKEHMSLECEKGWEQQLAKERAELTQLLQQKRLEELDKEEADLLHTMDLRQRLQQEEP